MAKYVRIEDVAELLKISVTTADKWLKQNNKPIIKKRKAPPEDNIYENIKTISDMLGISEKSLRKWADTKKIPHVWYRDTRLSFKTSEVIEWANNKGYISMLTDIM